MKEVVFLAKISLKKLVKFQNVSRETMRETLENTKVRANVSRETIGMKN